MGHIQPDNLFSKFSINPGFFSDLRRASSLPEFPYYGFNPCFHLLVADVGDAQLMASGGQGQGIEAVLVGDGTS